MPGVPPARYGYLGPEGTFTEAALLQVRAAQTGERLPYPSVDAALAAVREGEITAAMVPIENSVEGGVGATLDALSVGEDVVVVREALVPVQFVLAARPGTRLEDVRRLSTHPHAQAQCRHWLGAHLPDAVYVPGLSTAAAAAGLDPAGEPDPGYDATLCARVAADRYGLDVLVDGRRRQPVRRHAVRAGVAADRAAAAHRRRQDLGRGVPVRRPPRRSAGAARAVRRPRHQPDLDPVAPHRASRSAGTASRSTPRATSPRPGSPRR